MNPAELQPTIRIQRDELLRLLDTMTPTAQQTITARHLISEIDAELGRTATPPKPRPLSHAAALLAPGRPTRPAPLVRAKTQPGAPAAAVQATVPEPAEPSPPLPIETTPVADSDVIDIHSELSTDHGHAIHLTAHAPAARPRQFPLVATVAAVLLVWLSVVVFLV
jgi:hypothetical protein